MRTHKGILFLVNLFCRHVRLSCKSRQRDSGFLLSSDAYDASGLPRWGLARYDALGLRMCDMILSGWKAVADYMGCGVRTVQRWERKGFPVHRPVPSRRSHVVARSEEIDHWIRYSASRARARHSGSDLLSSLAKARKLLHEVKLAREELHLKMAALRKELLEMRAKRRHIF